MMKLRTASEAGRRSRTLSRPAAEGGATVAWAAAAPLIVLALAVAADRAHVSRFRTQVQLAAEAASLASAAAVARHPDGAGDGVATRVAAAVFARNAPRGAAGTPTVAATSRGAVATAT
jgi:Flp pilus assembly protein TadG